MTQEQARQEAERRVSEYDNVIYYYKLGGKNKDSKGLPISMNQGHKTQCSLIAINREIELLDNLSEKDCIHLGMYYIFVEIRNDLNQIKDELLKM
jgi:hypothetical protein